MSKAATKSSFISCHLFLIASLKLKLIASPKLKLIFYCSLRGTAHFTVTTINKRVQRWKIPLKGLANCAETDITGCC